LNEHPTLIDSLPLRVQLFVRQQNMGHFYDEIPDDPKLIEWIKTQNIFHVASAPLNGELSYASHDVETDKTIDLIQEGMWTYHPEVNPLSSLSTERLAGSWTFLALVRSLGYQQELTIKLNLTAGNETISHLYEPGNGRITILFQAFEGPPRIVRLYGKGLS
jgi:hypothetical protein